MAYKMKIARITYFLMIDESSGQRGGGGGWEREILCVMQFNNVNSLFITHEGEKKKKNQSKKSFMNEIKLAHKNILSQSTIIINDAA